MFCKCVKRTKKSYKKFQKLKLCISCLLQHSFTLNCLVFCLQNFELVNLTEHKLVLVETVALENIILNNKAGV